MKAAIDYLGKVENRRRIAVLGDMLELGEYSESLHHKVGEEVVKNNIDVLVTVGEMGSVISNVAKDSKTEIFHFENNADAINKIKSIMKAKDIILVKASNGMKFKEIVEALRG